MAKTLVPPLTSVEVARLEQGLASLAQWSEKLLVSFIGHRLINPKVVWCNRRWFVERGFNLAEKDQESRVSEWLVERFGWVAECRGVSKETKLLHADRYGATDGTIQHGGSGRVATLGCFQAKGVGQTPLVTDGAPPGHSHGCLSIAEALREAIFAEIAFAEFPHGAVPVIAIIDTGLYFSSSNLDDRYDQNVRRAILVRPAVVRPAHAERAPLFKRSVEGFINSQADDVQRTRDMIAKWMVHDSVKGLGSELEVLTTLVRAVVEQIAFGQVHRLFSGGYFSSNISICGGLLDFGNAHALPNWERAQVHSVLPGFGEEMTLFKRVIASLAFYFAKYISGNNYSLLSRKLQVSADDYYDAAWRRYSLQLIGSNDIDEFDKELIYDIFRSYFISQQKCRVKYRFGEVVDRSKSTESNWLYHAFYKNTSSHSGEDGRALFEIDDVLKKYDESTRAVAWCTAARLLKPRDNIDRKRLLQASERLVPMLGENREMDVKAIKWFISDSINKSRRYWRNLPIGYVVQAHTTLDGCSALICTDKSMHPFIWLEGVIGSCDSLYLFGRCLDVVDLRRMQICRFGTHWSSTCPLRISSEGEHIADLASGAFALPAMTVNYEFPVILAS